LEHGKLHATLDNVQLTVGHSRVVLSNLDQGEHWTGLGIRLLLSVSVVYSFLKYLRYTTNRQVNKFEKLQLTFRFWSPRRDLFSDPLRNRNLCLGHDPYYGNHWLQRL